MAEKSIYGDIAKRTGGDIYIGVVGPVRSGKSTFITRFMNELVLPNMGEGYSRERARDEMPQSAAGVTVMTTEPKFVPDEAVSLAAKILIEHLELFMNLSESAANTEVLVNKPDSKGNEVLKMTTYWLLLF